MKFSQNPRPISDWFLAQHFHQNGRVLRVRDGSFADLYLHPSGYRMVRYQEKGIQERHFAHRVIWVLCNGPIPDGLQIDHIDRDRTNNHIGNLRLATRSMNQHNRNSRGPFWRSDINKWYVQVRSPEGTKYLGTFADYQEAKAVYMAEKAKYLPKAVSSIEVPNGY